MSRSPFYPMLITALIFGLGCGGPKRGGGGGSGGQGGQGGGSGGAGGAGGAGGGGKPDVCTPACASGLTCVRGDCLTTACAEAAKKSSFQGCLFYAVDSDNYVGNDNLAAPDSYYNNDTDPSDVVVANPSSSSTATVVVEVRMPKDSKTWTMIKKATLMPKQVQIVPFGPREGKDMNSQDRHVEGTALEPGLAYRITSDQPVVAYFFNSDDSDGGASSTGGTLLIPKVSLGPTYYVASLPGVDVKPMADPWKLTKTEIMRGIIEVIGVADGTAVKVRPTATVLAGKGVMEIAAGSEATFMLDEGDVLQLESKNDGGDLTGSWVEADKPIAVWGSHTCGMFNKRNDHVCDKVEEQLLPIRAWGKEYVGARVVLQQWSSRPRVPAPNCGVDDDRSARWRIFAAEDDTTVDVTPGGFPITFDKPPPWKLAKGGDWTEVKSTGPAIETPGDFYMKADKPIQVMQYMLCEAEMASAVPVEQMLSEYLFSAPPFFDNQLAIVRKKGDTVTLDGAALAKCATPGYKAANVNCCVDDWQDAGGGFEVCRVDLPGSVCRMDPKKCNHTVAGSSPLSQIGITVRGMDTNCSYLYVGGSGFKCINASKTAGGCP